MIANKKEYAYAIVVETKNKEIIGLENKIKSNMYFLFLATVKENEIKFLKTVFDTSVNSDLYVELFDQYHGRKKFFDNDTNFCNYRSFQNAFSVVVPEFNYIKDFEKIYKDELSSLKSNGQFNILENNLVISTQKYSYFNNTGQTSTYKISKINYRILYMFNNMLPLERECFFINESDLIEKKEITNDYPDSLTNIKLQGKVSLSAKAIYQLMMQILNLLPVKDVSKQNFLTDHVNKKIFSETLSIFDLPSFNDSRNKYYFDFSGKMLKKKTLIAKGEIKEIENYEFVTTDLSLDSTENFTNILIHISDFVNDEVDWYLKEFSFNTILNPQTGDVSGIVYAYKSGDSKNEIHAIAVNFSIMEMLKKVTKNDEVLHNYKNLWSNTLTVYL